jgi:hypothetical protein
MRVPRHGLLALTAFPVGCLAVTHTHLLSAGLKAEPAPPDLSDLLQQPVAPHDPPGELTPIA